MQQFIKTTLTPTFELIDMVDGYFTLSFNNGLYFYGMHIYESSKGNPPLTNTGITILSIKSCEFKCIKSLQSC